VKDTEGGQHIPMGVKIFFYFFLILSLQPRLHNTQSYHNFMFYDKALSCFLTFLFHICYYLREGILGDKFKGITYYHLGHGKHVTRLQ